MSLWMHWCNAIWRLRPAFSRLQTFLWFATAVAGFTARADLLGVTSIVRALNLDARYYNALRDSFHSSAVKLDQLTALWTQLVLRLFPQTLRVNGTARLSYDPELLAAAAVNGREPRLVILVTVKEAFLHCGKALKRSKLWHDDYRVDKKDFPSLGRMIVEQTKPANVTVEQADEVVEEGYRNKLY